MLETLPQQTALPHSQEAERAVLAAVLLEPAPSTLEGEARGSADVLPAREARPNIFWCRP